MSTHILLKINDGNHVTIEKGRGNKKETFLGLQETNNTRGTEASEYC